MPVEESISVEEFYETTNKSFRGLCGFAAREEWREKNIYRTLERLWSMPEECWVEKAPNSDAEDANEWAGASADELEIAFLGHAAKWERDTRYVSSMTDVVSHPSYMQIIAMGRASRKFVLSLLLRDLKENERPWFTALAQIAGANPMSPSDAGRVDRMSKAWIRWGMKEGLL
ncbi:MAG: hypothetical protein ABSA85_12280 [Terracidiphilus sp.]|jgi:hypothetical protein